MENRWVAEWARLTLARFKSKRFLYVFWVPVVIFLIAFVLTLLQGVLLYMWLGFLVAWAVHFYAKFYYSRKVTDE